MMCRRGRGQVWGWRYDCGTALLWRGGDRVWAIWVGEGLNELVRWGKEYRKSAIAGGVLGTGDPVIGWDLHGRVADLRGAGTWTRRGA